MNRAYCKQLVNRGVPSRYEAEWTASQEGGRQLGWYHGKRILPSLALTLGTGGFYFSYKGAFGI
jgi:hypothetical protein